MSQDSPLRTIGLIGGMSWESTLVYYRMINRGVRDRLGPLHSARLLIDSLDFSDIEPLQRAGAWERAGELLADSARRLHAGGAQCILLATNTMHKVADYVIAATPLPFLHIAEATGKAIRDAGIDTVLLLGTAFTMEQDFYRGRLRDVHGIRCLTPPAEARREIHRIIYEELCAGAVRDASRQTASAIIVEAWANGAKAVILGCTELGLLIGPESSPVPLFDTTALHAQGAVDFSMSI